MKDAERRPSGRPPYWAAGTQILWRSGDGPLAVEAATSDRDGARRPRFAEPVTVVRDDAEGLVVWLAAGTPVLRVARSDGLPKRADKRTLFTAEVHQETGIWTDYHVLRISPTGERWSVWVMFFAEENGRFAGWYVNLEDVHTRDRDTVYTRDHVLDLDVEPDGIATRKDEDELVLAVAQGCFDAALARRIEADADAVESLVSAWGSPFRDGWEHFRPDRDWPIPSLSPWLDP